MSVIEKSRVVFEPVKPLVGSIVRAKREDLFDPEVVRECRRMLDERTILVFPEVNFTNEEQLAFTDMFGGRLNLTSDATTDKSDDVYQVTLDRKINKAPEYVLGTFFWHMDGLPVDTPPPLATLLAARKIAPKGGQTEFANTIAAYNALPEDEKAELDKLRVIHTVEASLRSIADQIPEADKGKLQIGVPKEHPLVRVRADGVKALVIGATADRVVGRDVAHGRALLTRLVEWAARPEFTYRHEWKQGDFVVWDNCAAMHRVIPYDYESGRMMHRTSVAAPAA
jgi:alpha-ketoglutarate-dependent taurine dioxygenase